VNNSLPKYLYFLRSLRPALSGFKHLHSAWSFLLCLITAALLTSGLAACVTETPPLRVGTTAGIVSDNLYLAQELQYYRDGMVRLIDYPSADDQLRAFRNQQIDVTAVSLCDALILTQKNPDLRGILLLSRSNGEDVLVANSSIAALKDIAGQSIGVEASSRSRLMLSQALERAQLSHQDVQLVSLSLSEQITAFKQGTVAAVATHEPVRSSLLFTGGHDVFPETNRDNDVLNILLVNKNVIKERRRHLVDFSQACLKASYYASQHSQKASEYLAKRHQLSSNIMNQIAKLVHDIDLAENQRLLHISNRELNHQVQAIAQKLQRQQLLQGVEQSNLIWDDSIVNQIKG